MPKSTQLNTKIIQPVERVHPDPAGHFVTARGKGGKIRTERAWRIPWNTKPQPEQDES